MNVINAQLVKITISQIQIINENVLLTYINFELFFKPHDRSRLSYLILWRNWKYDISMKWILYSKLFLFLP